MSTYLNMSVKSPASTPKHHPSPVTPLTDEQLTTIVAEPIHETPLFP